MSTKVTIAQQAFPSMLQDTLKTLATNPEKFNQLTRSLILSLSKLHNSHNRLLPPYMITHLIEQLHQAKVFCANRRSALKFSLYFNMLRLLILTNFAMGDSPLNDNKFFSTIGLIFAQKQSDYYHELKTLDKSFIILKNVAQWTVVNEIMLRLAQRSKTFFPEYIKSLSLTLEKLQNSIQRNLKHSEKTKQKNSTINGLEDILIVAFSNDTEKKQLIYYITGLFSFVLKQAASYIRASSNKKDLVRLSIIQQMINKVDILVNRLPQHISLGIIVPAEFKNYDKKGDGQQQNNQQQEPIYLEEPIKVRQLTPRMYNEEQETQNKLLRKKRNKLQKKMQNQLRSTTQIRLQEQRIVSDVKRDKANRHLKKQLFVMQKQTQEAKKFQKQLKKVKSIKKESKGSKGGGNKLMGRKGRKGKK